MYYVYTGKVDDQIVYVGKGTGARRDHLNSGISSCYAANRHHHTGGWVHTDIVYRTPNEADALELELHLIREISPAWNTIKPGRAPAHGNKDFKRAGATSAYFGVSYCKGEKKKPWRAWYRFPNRKQHVGYYATEKEAAEARDKFVVDNLLPDALNLPY